VEIYKSKKKEELVVAIIKATRDKGLNTILFFKT
jgi:hypothetical protein